MSTIEDYLELSDNKAEEVIIISDYDGTITVFEGWVSYHLLNLNLELSKLLGKDSEAYKYLMNPECDLKDFNKKTIQEKSLDELFTENIQKTLLSALFKLEGKYINTPLNYLKNNSVNFKQKFDESSPEYEYIFSDDCKLKNLKINSIYTDITDSKLTDQIKDNLVKNLCSLSNVYHSTSVEKWRGFNQKLKEHLDESSEAYQYIASDNCQLPDLCIDTIHDKKTDEYFTDNIKKFLIKKLVRNDVIELMKKIRNSGNGAVYITSRSSKKTLYKSLKIIGLNDYVNDTNVISDPIWQHYDPKRRKLIFDASRSQQIEYMVSFHNIQADLIDDESTDYEDNIQLLLDADDLDASFDESEESEPKKMQTNLSIIFLDDSNENHQEIMLGRKFLNKFKSKLPESGNDFDLIDHLKTKENLDDYLQKQGIELSSQEKNALSVILGKKKPFDPSIKIREAGIASAVNVLLQNKSFNAIQVKANQTHEKLVDEITLLLDTKASETQNPFTYKSSGSQSTTFWPGDNNNDNTSQKYVSDIGISP